MDRTYELRQEVSRLNEEHDMLLRRFQIWLGRLFSWFCRFRVCRWFVERVFSRFAAWAILKFHICGVERRKDQDAVSIALNYLRIPTFLRMPVEVESATSERVELVWKECAIGLTDPSSIHTCRTACTIDIETVKRLGGHLEVTENILMGDEQCRFVITSP